MSDKVNILTPVGRLVQGSCFEGQTKDMENRPILIKTGPNAGQPGVRFFMALAVPKGSPGLIELQTVIAQEAQRGFPTLFDAVGNCTVPTFAWKWVDGDSQIPGTTGRKPCETEGFSGNIVFKFTGGYAPKCHTKNGESVIVDPEGIKRGYYIRIAGTVVSNDVATKPGVYLNPNLVELVGFGEEISSGPDGSAVFGGAPVVGLPAGASATPLATGAPIQWPGGVQQGAAGVQPAHNFLNQAAADTAGAAGGAQLPPPPTESAADQTGGAVQPNRLVNGHSFTVLQLIQGNYSPAQINALPIAP